ncbi:MAG: hypothetical protein JNG84_09525, partial [Archangium sp.]|nr:hypothetical protein [Archangium sp.]
MSLAALVLVPVVVCASGAGAPDEAWEARLQAGLSSRSGSWQAPSRTLTYDGLSLESVAVRGWAWLLLDVLGLAAALELDAFGVFDQGARVAGVRLARAHLGPTARLRLGPARLEALVAYALHTVPAFDTAEPSTLTAVMRHSVLLGARAFVDVGPVTIEGRFEAPLPSGYSVGGGVRVKVARTGSLVWRVMAEGGYSVDSYANAVGLQQVVRAGVGLDLAWQALPEVPHTGAVRVSVSTDDGEPLMEPVLSVETAAGPLRVRLDALGTARLPDVEAGPVSATLRIDGYEPALARVEVMAGGEAHLQLALRRVRRGALVVTVRDAETHAPLAGALVALGAARLRTNDAGQVTLPDLAPGATAVEV